MQLLFYRYHFVQCRHEEVSATHRRIADLDTVNDLIGLAPDVRLGVVQLFHHLVDALAGLFPLEMLVHALHHHPLDGFAAHIFADVARREVGALLVAIDFLEDEAQYGGVNQRLLVFLLFL